MAPEEFGFQAVGITDHPTSAGRKRMGAKQLGIPMWFDCGDFLFRVFGRA